MFSALAKAFGQLSDPAFRRVFAISVLASLVVFILLWIAAWLGLSWAGEALSGWMAGQEPGGFWVGVFEWLFGAAGLVGVLVASFFLFPAVMVVVMSFLLEDIAEAVERRHYPELTPAREQPLGEAVVAALTFVAVTLLLNLLILPLLFVPFLNLFVFYLLNGYLLGREYFELVAARRFDSAGVRRLRRKYRGRVMLAGVAIAFMLTVPLLNLVAPIVATGYMLHVFERLRRREAEAEA
jgi:CysZ protein